MPRPVIGITTDHNDRFTQYMLPHGYSASVEKAGGLPFLLPYRTDLSLIPEFVDHLDGIVFSGGDDLDPSTWGEARHPGASPIDPEREKFEMALFAEVERRRLPTLGICLGCQLINVHRGGSMIQFLPDHQRDKPIEHRRAGGIDWSNRHAVSVQPKTRLAEALGKSEIITNSSHKQAVKNTGRGLRIVATAPDGVVEG